MDGHQPHSAPETRAPGWQEAVGRFVALNSDIDSAHPGGDPWVPPSKPYISRLEGGPGDTSDADVVVDLE